MRHADAATTSCAASSRATATRTASRPTPTSRRSPRCALHIDSWRWAGVPFYIRAGKELPVTCTEVRVELHRPPQRVFAEYERRCRTTPTTCGSGSSPRSSIAIGRAGRRLPGEASSATDVELYLCNDHPDEELGVRAAARRRDARRVAAVRARGRRRGGLAGRRPRAHRPRAGPHVRAQHVGPRRGGRAPAHGGTSGTIPSRDRRGAVARPTRRNRVDRDRPAHQQQRRPADGHRARAGDVGGRCPAGRPFATVLSSPLSCSVETCRLAGYGDRVETDDDLKEWDYGEYEGRTTAEIRAERPGVDRVDGLARRPASPSTAVVARARRRGH